MSKDAKVVTAAIKATVELQIAGRPLRLEVPVPAGPARLSELLPFLRELTDAFVAFAVENAQDQGATLSCRKGCGACCRQLVPIAEIEARRLREVVARLPDARRATLEARFAAARLRLQQAGLLDKLAMPNQVRDEEVDALGLAYFHLGIPCPFLEDESCSIYSERPLACREYLVLSPAAHCAQPTVDNIEPVQLVARVARTVRVLDSERSATANRWLALILALDWAAAHGDFSLPEAGPDLVRAVFARLLDPTSPKGAAG